jgi:hypothetical protein
VAWDAAELDVPEVRAGVEGLAPVQAAELHHDGHVIRDYYYRFAYGYRGFPPQKSDVDDRETKK